MLLPMLCATILRRKEEAMWTPSLHDVSCVLRWMLMVAEMLRLILDFTPSEQGRATWSTSFTRRLNSDTLRLSQVSVEITCCQLPVYKLWLCPVSTRPNRAYTPTAASVLCIIALEASPQAPLSRCLPEKSPTAGLPKATSMEAQRSSSQPAYTRSD